MRQTRRGAIIAAAALFVSSARLSGQTPERVSVYAFSRDSLRGLDDTRLDAFRRDLGKYADPAMEIAYSREEAAVTVQLLGEGRLVVELDEHGDPSRHLWTPDDEASILWAVVRTGGEPVYAKEFSVEGSGARDWTRLARDVGEWIKDNAPKLQRQ